MLDISIFRARCDSEYSSLRSKLSSHKTDVLLRVKEKISHLNVQSLELKYQDF